MDITFTCNKCDQSLTIDEAGAGQLVDCPKCRTPLEVPYKSQPAPAPAPTAPPDKKCPFCAETIKQEAKVCRFCGIELATGKPFGNATAASAQTLQAEAKPVNGTRRRYGLGVVTALLVILCALLLWLNQPEYIYQTVCCLYSAKNCLDDYTVNGWEVVREEEIKNNHESPCYIDSELIAGIGHRYDNYPVIVYHLRRRVK